MLYRELKPGPRLARFVECFWVLQSAPGDVRPSSPERIFPDGCPEMILNFGEPFRQIRNGCAKRQPRSFLVGQIRGPMTVEPSRRAGVFVIRFRPSGLWPLLPCSQHELAGSVVGLDAVGMPDLGERVAEAGSDAARIQVAEEFLLARLRDAAPDLLVETAVASIVAANGAVSMDRLTNRLGIGPRHLTRRFRERVGLSPKRFARIIRFQTTLQALQRRDRGGLRRRPGCRLLRPGALHQRVPGILGPDAVGLSFWRRRTGRLLRPQGAVRFLQYEPAGSRLISSL